MAVAKCGPYRLQTVVDMYIAWGRAKSYETGEAPTPAFYAHPGNLDAFAKWLENEVGLKIGTKELGRIMQEAAIRDGMPAEWRDVNPDAVAVEAVKTTEPPVNPSVAAHRLQVAIKKHIFQSEKGGGKMSRRFDFVSVTAAHKPASVLQELGVLYLSDEFVKKWRGRLNKFAGKTTLSPAGLKKLVFRATFLNPTWMKETHPELYQAVIDELSPEILEAIEEYGLNARKLAGLDAKGRASLHIESAEAADATVHEIQRSWKSARGIINRIWHAAWDDRDALFQAYQYILKVNNIEHIPARDDLRVQLSLMAGRDRRFMQVMALGIPDPNTGNFITPGGFGWLMAPLKPTEAQISRYKSEEAAAWANQRDAVLWMIAHRVVELHGQKAKAAIEAAEAQKAEGKKPDLATLVQELTPIGGDAAHEFATAWEVIQQIREERGDEIAQLEEAHKRYTQWADALLDYAVAKKYISKKEKARIRGEGQYYVALSRVLSDPTDLPDDGSEVFARIAKGEYSGVGNLMAAREAFHSLEGSQKRIQDPYMALAQNTRRMMNEIDRNHVKATLIMPMLPDGVLPTEATTDTEALEGFSILFGSIARPVAGKPHGRKDIIEVRLPTADGDVVTTYWHIPDKHLREALEGTARPSSKVIDYAAKIVHVARTSITKNPQFALRNVIRDMSAANIIYGNLAPFHASVLRMMREAHEIRSARMTEGNRNSVWRQLELWGGGQFGYFLTDPKAYRSLLVDALKGGKSALIGVEKIGTLWAKYEALLAAGEVASRMETFKRHAEDYAKKHRDDPDYSEGDALMYAAWKARGLLDFAVGGSVVKELNQVSMFLNPRFQGLRVEAKAMFTPGGFARVLTYNLLGVAAELWWNEQQDALDELATLPLWRRLAFWNLKIGHVFLMIPKPFGLFAAPSYPLQYIGLRHSAAVLKERGEGGKARAINTALDVDVMTGWHPYSVWRHMFDMLSPVDPDIATFPGVGPLLYNYDRWRDRQIVPPWETEQPVSERVGTKYASGLSQFLSKLTKESLDPRQIDIVIGDFFGWYGKVGTELTKPNPNLWRVLGFGFVGESAGSVSPQAQYALGQARRFQNLTFPVDDDYGMTPAELSRKTIEILTDANRRYARARTAEERERIAKQIRAVTTVLARTYMNQEPAFARLQERITKVKKRIR